MTTVRAAAPIPLPIETCWTYFRDLTRAKDYVPGLTDCVIVSDIKEGVGASRIVSHRQFGDMHETVTTWNEGVGMIIRLHKGDAPPKPFKEASFEYSFRRVSEGETEIHTALHYTLPFGLLGRALDKAFLSRIFARNVIDTACCLAENYRTGAPVPESEVPGLRANAL
ncbi:MAG: SRPBCC family protein [Myxococcota bacterium]